MYQPNQSEMKSKCSFRRRDNKFYQKIKTSKVFHIFKICVKFFRLIKVTYKKTNKPSLVFHALDEGESM